VSLHGFASDFSPFMSFYELIANQDSSIRKSLYQLLPPPCARRRRTDRSLPSATSIPSRLDSNPPVDAEQSTPAFAEAESIMLQQHFLLQGRELQRTVAAVNDIARTFSFLAATVESQQLVQEQVEASLEEASDSLGAGTQILHRCRKIMQSGVCNVFLLYAVFSWCLLLMHWIYE
jgi:hypothetical protein